MTPIVGVTAVVVWLWLRLPVWFLIIAYLRIGWRWLRELVARRAMRRGKGCSRGAPLLAALVLAALVLALVGLVSLANVLFLDVREQAAHYAALRATGWPDRSLATLLTWQAVAIGVVGSSVGAALAFAGLAAMSALTTTTVMTTLLIAALGVGAAALVSLLPASGLRRIPTARLLAGE